jgi:glycosyltransferase involved in cell wall biosynthesis
MFGAFALTVFMSGYAESVWRTFFKDIGKSVRIPNGVDRDLFKPLDKELGYLIFASAPNRGLRRLPLILDSIRTRVNRPVVLKAYSNMAVLHPGEKFTDDPYEKDGFGLAHDAGSVEVLNPIPQAQLAQELGRAGLMILPTDYPEICSNIILQSLACGTPVVTTGGIGSAGEWVRHGKNGMLTRFRPVDYMVYIIEMVRNAVSLLEDEIKHRKMIEVAQRTGGIYTWKEIGLKWEKALKKLF